MNSPSVTYDLFFLLNFYQKRILFNNVKYILFFDTISRSTYEIID